MRRPRPTAITTVGMATAAVATGTERVDVVTETTAMGAAVGVLVAIVAVVVVVAVAGTVTRVEGRRGAVPGTADHVHAAVMVVGDGKLIMTAVAIGIVVTTKGMTTGAMVGGVNIIAAAAEIEVVEIGIGRLRIGHLLKGLREARVGPCWPVSWARCYKRTSAPPERPEKTTRTARRPTRVP